MVLATLVRPAIPAVMTGVAVLLAAAGTLALLRVWQQRRVTVLLERTLALPAVVVPAARERLPPVVPTGDRPHPAARSPAGW